MKRRLTPVIIGIAVLLIASIAFAADRKKQVKRVTLPVDPVHEEETFRAELLEAVDDHDRKLRNPDTVGKFPDARAEKKSEQSELRR